MVVPMGHVLEQTVGQADLPLDEATPVAPPADTAQQAPKKAAVVAVRQVVLPETVEEVAEWRDIPPELAL